MLEVLSCDCHVTVGAGGDRLQQKAQEDEFEANQLRLHPQVVQTSAGRERLQGQPRIKGSCPLLDVFTIQKT